MNILTSLKALPQVWIHSQSRAFARMTGRAGKMQHFRYGVGKVRGRWYYRYHKPIGRANWKGYQERYIPPKDVEAKQRLVFAPKPTTSQLRKSISWEWRLPKLLAQATTSNQLLDAWILFRYRHPKRMCHYMMALRRLVELGGCDPSDWRLRVLLSRMRRGYKRIINYDILLRYMSSLYLYQEMERVSRFLKPRVKDMKPQQLVSVLNSFGKVHLRDPAIAGLCSRYIRRHVPSLSSDDLVNTVQSLGKLEIRNSVLLTCVFSELSRRELNLCQLHQALAASRVARFRDYLLIDRATMAVRASAMEGNAGDWPEICGILSELSHLHVPDPVLATEVVQALDPYIIPLSSLLQLARSCFQIVDRDEMLPLIEVISESIVMMTNKSNIIDAAIVMDGVLEDIETTREILKKLADRLVFIRSDPSCYDVPSLAEIFQRRGIDSAKVWKCLSSDIKSSLEDFEPVDFIKTAETFGCIPQDRLGDLNSSLANEIAEWSLKRWEEFDSHEWEKLKTSLTVTEHFTCNPFYRDELNKWGLSSNLVKVNANHSVKSI